MTEYYFLFYPKGAKKLIQIKDKRFSTSLMFELQCEIIKIKKHLHQTKSKIHLLNKNFHIKLDNFLHKIIV